jgi:NADH-quinone oxidoreductase subunit G
MPKCKINGKEVEVAPGTSIIKAFKAAGQEICHYCWHEGLSVAGVCRLCMVEIEGNPRLQIACNTPVAEGMVINNQSDKVKDTVQWGLDFHLINHPLDCPICDQAGECGLQDQYMQFGKYDPEMAERKVKKRKAVDLGPTVVLDTERCILCSRCVRFTSEISKTNELGIFNRGDRSEIGTFTDKPLNNKYSLNTVDICPVGALTSKDFRFRQRVWYLKKHDSVCTGCATGCNVSVYHNEEGLWRVKPRENPEVNGFWMCDEGRDVYKYVNRNYRLLNAMVGSQASYETMDPGALALQVGKMLKSTVEQHGAEAVALVLTGQYTNEEYEEVLKYFGETLGSNQVYHWIDSAHAANEFDGILLRGDRNPNTKGLMTALEQRKVKASWSDLEKRLANKSLKAVVVAGPENQAEYSDITEKVNMLRDVENVVWLTANPVAALEERKCRSYIIPTKTYFEKRGTFVNYKGLAQKVEIGAIVVKNALTLAEAAILMRGENLPVMAAPVSDLDRKKNYFTAIRGAL